MGEPTKSHGVFEARVAANREICLEHYVLTFRLGGFPPSRPGQFVNVLCGGGELAGAVETEWPEGRLPRVSQIELLGRRPLLRRPLSLAGRRDDADGVELEIIHHVVGVGTAWLAGLGEGDTVSLAGPLGNGFAIHDDRPVAALLGGGVGIPPMLYLAATLAGAGKDVTAFVGARTARMLPLTIDPSDPPSQAGWPGMCTAEFAARGAPTVVATDDGTLGVGGFVHEPFARWLAGQADAASRLAVYACGPEPMMRAVADLAAQAGAPCQLALERHMACGVGTCQGCVVKVRDGAAGRWKYKLACKDGPVFDAGELVWD